MAGGGKGGSQTTEVKVPAWLEAAAKENLSRASDVSQIGYTPYYGADIAAMTPTQMAGMQNTGQAANAFGLASADPTAGMPQAQTFAGGMQGYSSAPLYQQSLAALQAAAPGQFQAIQDMFLNPQTGQMAQPQAPVAGMPVTAGGMNSDRDPRTATAQQAGGYSGIGDMFNGGGPGAAGNSFQGGGLISTAANALSRPAGSGGSSGMGGGK